ncbi:hypothetical protein D584_00010 [Brucella intermedia M86]|uniref:Uncharacterized protein n=1 Tax=Brucella intermedia M86 TaxID=1234597 RepID=M5JSM8_9HYPH|nr:hypothetical protein D584_00010 [Brucella intermedia M86]
MMVGPSDVRRLLTNLRLASAPLSAAITDGPFLAAIVLMLKKSNQLSLYVRQPSTRLPHVEGTVLSQNGHSRRPQAESLGERTIRKRAADLNDWIPVGRRCLELAQTFKVRPKERLDRLTERARRDSWG